MKSAWIIQSETNIHVGDESTSNIGLVDKSIQKDVVTGIPCINASSLKGAMNEYATYKAGLSPEERIAIFGADKTDKKKNSQKGCCSFFDACMLLLPIPADDRLYRLVTSDEQIGSYLSLLEMVGVNCDKECLLAALEAICNPTDNHVKYFDRSKDILSAIQFKAYCEEDELPIVARNNLQGTGNLWYEQYLPQKTVFGTMLCADSDIVKVSVKIESEDKKKLYKTESVNIKDTIESTFNGKIVQIGANATVGYGYCRFTKI